MHEEKTFSLLEPAATEPHLLVLTSGFYELYKDRPEELRFLIGHEIGHIKCNHLRSHVVGRMLMQFITGNRPTSRIGRSITKRLVGQLLTWFREAEFSADRAGLLCVNGNLGIAKSALLRLKHGTHEDVNPEIAIQEQIDFLNQPFVKMVHKIRSRGAHPYAFDRCLALEKWSTSRAYSDLVRRKKLPPRRWLVIDEIQITDLPNSDLGFGKVRACDPIIKAAIGDEEFEAPPQKDDNNPTLRDLAWKAPFYPNTPIYVDVLDCDARFQFGNDFIGGSMVPIHRVTNSRGEFTMSLRRDIKQRSSAVNLPQVTLKFHFETQP